MKLHRKLGKTIPESVNESQTVVNNGDKKLNDKNDKFIGMEYVETSYDETNTPKSYYCKLCDCKFHDSNGRDAHLKGKRHRLSYKVTKFRLIVFDWHFVFLHRKKSIRIFKLIIIINHQVQNNVRMK